MQKKRIVSLLAFCLLLVSLPNLSYATTYQETFDTKIDGSFTTNESAFYDGDWATFAVPASSGLEEYLVYSYNIPYNAYGAYWQVKDQDGIQNYSVPYQCFTYDEDTLQFKTIMLSDLILSNYIVWLCYQGTYGNLRYKDTAPEAAQAYEEGIYWIDNVTIDSVYSTQVYETSTQQFNLSVSNLTSLTGYTLTVPSAQLIWNGTVYNASYLGVSDGNYSFSVNISIPLITNELDNISFYWNYTMNISGTTKIINTSSYQQYIMQSHYITDFRPSISSKNYLETQPISFTANVTKHIDTANLSMNVSFNNTNYTCNLISNTTALSRFQCNLTLPVISSANQTFNYTPHLFINYLGNTETISEFKGNGTTSALSFDGDGDYITITLDDLDSSNSFTAIQWLYFDNSSLDYQSPILKGDGHINFDFKAQTIDGKLNFVGSDTATSINALDNDTWYMLTYTYNTTHICLYLNTTLQECVSATISNSYTNLILGDQVSYHGYFKGNMDEVRLYQKLLTTSEISDEYNSYKGRYEWNISGLVGGWHIDEGTGTSLTDFSGNGNTGTITDATWTTGLVEEYISSDAITIYQIQFYNCTEGDSATALYFYYLNESNPSQRVNGTLQGDFDVWKYYLRNYSFSETTVVGNYSICIYPIWADATTNATITYNGGDYIARFYNLQNQEISNTTTDIKLYQLLSTSATEITIEVIDETGNYAEEIYIEILKREIGNSSYLQISNVITNVDGKAYEDLERSQTYRFLLYRDGSLVKDTGDYYLSASATTVSITIDTTLGGEFWTYYGLVSGVCGTSGTNDSLSLICNVSDPTLTMVQACLNVRDTYSLVLNCSTCDSSSYTPSLTCVIGNITGQNFTYVLTAEFSETTIPLVGDTLGVRLNLPDWDLMGVFISLLVIMGFALAGSISPIIMVVTTYLGVVVCVMLNMLPVGLDTLGVLAVIAIAVGYRVK